MFVLDKEQGTICRREITFTPALYKIFDEIVVNAADNKQRDPNMSEVRIVVDADANIISVQNDGTGLPIEHHKEHSCYVPSLVFGELLTGSNFDDTEAKTTVRLIHAGCTRGRPYETLVHRQSDTNYFVIFLRI